MATKTSTKTASRKQEGIPVSKYVLEFKPKYERAVANLPDGASESEILAEYDRLGGLITYEGAKVKMGSFYDFKAKKPVEKPQPKIVRKVEVQEEYIEEVEVEEKPKKSKKDD